MDFSLPDELVALRDTARRLAGDKVRPRAREIDESGDYPEDLFELFRDAGLLGLALPQEHGGAGAGVLGLVVAIEEVAKHSNAAALMLLLTRLPAAPLLVAGTPEQRQRFLPGIAEGSRRGAFGLSEPQAGSDVMGIRTRARPDPAVDGGWVLDGVKCWMSGVAQADWYVVFAKTSPDVGSRDPDALTAFVVERAWDGVDVGRLDRKMGVRGVDTGELVLDGVGVPPSHVVGEVGGGFRLAMAALNSMRPIVAARGIGLAEGAVMYATEYVEQRAAFERTVADFQGVQWELAKLAIEIEAARLLTYRAATMVDAGQVGKDAAPFLSMAKYAATELAVRASGVALQLLGAAGYTKEHPTELWYRDAKQLTIVEGTSQVQLGIVARGLLDRDVWWEGG